LKLVNTHKIIYDNLCLLIMMLWFFFNMSMTFLLFSNDVIVLILCLQCWLIKILCCHDIFAHASNHVMRFFGQIFLFFDIHVALHNLCFCVISSSCKTIWVLYCLNHFAIDNLCFCVSNIHFAKRCYVLFNVMWLKLN
jgi:hypothetical protein